MPIPVHALAHRPLPAAAVSELVALPTAPHVPDNDNVIAAEMQQRGWSWEPDLVCDSFRTGYGHVLCSDGHSPFGHPDARHFLVFGELYPLDPDDESMTNGPWLYDIMDDWQQLPGWSGRRPCNDQDCETVLAQAAQAVTEHLGTAPERTIPSSAAVVTGPALTHHIWRTPTHALVLGPAADNGPYGYLTHLQLSHTPLACGPDLPAADDEDGLARWITAHVDW
ncbi:hypothetical protein [Streptomyces sp. H27-D2]|uniref:hypothetical protein n=1 Tax=Streptomyces sp. H27-D2 TaxID=3046304 RepID=UPI002DBEE20B|nr:hypothetical protein [Streptomyces sp. H27-D2]MEC4018271.1 hypothetical protein [Streptomyces sp. H27-D2]